MSSSRSAHTGDKRLPSGSPEADDNSRRPVKRLITSAFKINTIGRDFVPPSLIDALMRIYCQHAKHEHSCDFQIPTDKTLNFVDQHNFGDVMQLHTALKQNQDIANFLSSSAKPGCESTDTLFMQLYRDLHGAVLDTSVKSLAIRTLHDALILQKPDWVEVIGEKVYFRQCYTQTDPQAGHEAPKGTVAIPARKSADSWYTRKVNAERQLVKTVRFIQEAAHDFTKTSIPLSIICIPEIVAFTSGIARPHIGKYQPAYIPEGGVGKIEAFPRASAKGTVRKEQLMETILRALVCNHEAYRPLLFPDQWHLLGRNVSFAEGFAAEAHNEHLSEELQHVAKLLWMIYTGNRKLDEMPDKTKINIAHQTPQGFTHAPMDHTHQWHAYVNSRVQPDHLSGVAM